MVFCLRLAFVLQELFQKSLVIGELSATISAKERANVLSQFARGKVNGFVIMSQFNCTESINEIVFF